VLISDGDWNEGGSPAGVAMQYRLRGIPIFGACAGSPGLCGRHRRRICPF